MSGDSASLGRPRVFFVPLQTSLWWAQHDKLKQQKAKQKKEQQKQQEEKQHKITKTIKKGSLLKKCIRYPYVKGLLKKDLSTKNVLFKFNVFK